MSELNAISIADGVWRPIIPLSNHQPAGNASALAAGRYAVHRECGARLATLRFVLTGSGVTETSGTGAFSRAKASRGGRLRDDDGSTRVENYPLWPLTI
jgi:hypothetical protein